MILKHVVLAAGLAILVATPAVVAQQKAGQPQEKQENKDPKAAPVLTGKWTMQIEAPAPHGNMTAALTLKHEGKKVTGAMSAPGHGSDSPVEGEFADGTLKLVIPNPDPAAQTTLTAKLKDDGTLAGFISGPMGDMKWTANRK